MTMTNDSYRDHVYAESFEDTLKSFDQYVQESTALIIAGIAVFIALLIALIRKIFFARKTVQGSSDSVYFIYVKINALLDQPGLPRKITVKKGVDISETFDPSITLRDLIRAYNNELEKWLEDPNRLVLDIGALNQMKQNNANEIQKLQNSFIKRTYDTGELRGYVKRIMVMYKEAADELKTLDKLQKKIEKNKNIKEPNKEVLNSAYKEWVNLFNVERQLNNEWYKNIKAGINEGLAER